MLLDENSPSLRGTQRLPTDEAGRHHGDASFGHFVILEGRDNPVMEDQVDRQCQFELTHRRCVRPRIGDFGTTQLNSLRFSGRFWFSSVASVRTRLVATTRCRSLFTSYLLIRRECALVLQLIGRVIGAVCLCMRCRPASVPVWLLSSGWMPVLEVQEHATVDLLSDL